MIPNNQFWFNSYNINSEQYFFERFTEIPELAYSFDQLHAGALRCIEVERSSDNAKKDIGFRNRRLDVETILAFVGSGSGYVRTFYSQVDNNHLIQYTYSLQPRIALSGVIDKDTKTDAPMMYFDGDRLDLTTSISAAAPFSCFQTIKRFVTSTAAPMLSSSVADAPFAIMEYTDGYYYSRSSTKTFISTSSDSSVSKHCVAGIQQTTSAGSVYTGNTSIVGSNISTSGIGNFVSIGIRETVSAKGYLSELIFYRSDQTTNALAINADRTGNGAMVRLPSTATDGALILEIGQSNITDRATIQGNLPLELQKLQPHTFTFFKQSNGVSNNGFWSKVKAGVNTTPEGGVYGYYGIEPSLGARLKSVYGKSAYFIPVGVGGTGLDAAITQPNWAATTGTLYARAVLMFQQALSKSDKTLTPIVIWRHGNYDASNATWAANYQANEAALFAQLRTDLGLPNLKIISVQLESSTTYTYKNTVRAAKIAVAAADANVILWDNPYPLGPDNEHDNPQSASFGGVQSKTLIGYDLADIISTFI